MTIKTDISQADWAAFVRHVTQSAAKGVAARLEMLGLALLVGAAIGGVFWLTGMNLDIPSMGAGFLGGLVVLIVLSRLRMRRLNPEANGLVLGPREVTLDDDGLHLTSAQHASVFCWEAIRRIEGTDKHVFIMLDRNSAVILPRRSFATLGECEQFVNEVARRSGKTVI